MEQLQIGLPPKRLRSGALAGPAASGAPNQQQAAQQRGGDGMDVDDARSEISHPESHPDSESSASSFSGNRAAPLHATSIGSSRPCQPPKRSGRMQLDDPEAPLDVDGVTEESIQEFIDNLMQELPNEVVLQLSDSGGSPDNA